MASGRASGRKNPSQNQHGMKDSVYEIKDRASPVESDAQIRRPKSARNGLGLPSQGRDRLKKLVQKVRKVRYGTLNVGTMTGKSREITDMMKRRRVNVLCVQETRWRGNKAKELAEGYKLFYSGADVRARNGVGIVVDRELKGEVCEVYRKSDRIMSVKLDIGGGYTRVICAYAPQTGCEEEEKEIFWREMDEVWRTVNEEESDYSGRPKRPCG